MELKTANDYADYAESLFRQGYNCAQAVSCAFCNVTGMEHEFTQRLSSPFGGGMGRLREVCGAVSGMFIVLGALEGYTDTEGKEHKTELYKTVQDLAAKFEDENGSIVCREILGLRQGKSEHVPESRTPEYYKKRPCPVTVNSAARILAEHLIEKGFIKTADDN